MKRSEIATVLLETIDLYDDFIQKGFKRSHIEYDFSYLDIIRQEKDTNRKIQNKEKLPVEIIDQETINLNKNIKRSIIELSAKILACKKCVLHQRALTKVTGGGNPCASIFVISYPPTKDEEMSGLPLKGKTEEYFIKWMNAINLTSNDYFVTNLIKCCQNSTSLTKSIIACCEQYLIEQLKIINPKIILTLGQLTISSLQKSFTPLQTHHGKLLNYNGFNVLPTYHPVEVFQNNELKREVWEDLKKLNKYMNN